MQTTILLADDHHMVREGLRLMLQRRDDFTVVAEASDGEETVRLVAEKQPDVALIDLCMPRLSGIEAIHRIRKDRSATRCVVLSMHDSRSHVEQALEAGASAYVVKSAAMSELFDAIDAVRQGKSYLSPEIAKQVVYAFANPNAPAPALSQLTSREREVLQLIAEGHSSKEISELLGVSFKTVESHRSRLMLKLGIHKVSQLVRFAIQHGVVAV